MDDSLVRRVAEGNPAAAGQLYVRYAERLRGLARAAMSRGLARRVEADDIVQSAFRRFFAAAQRGRYRLPTGDELGDLLVAITLNRVRSEEAHHRAAKRDLRQTVGGGELLGLTAPGAEAQEAHLALAAADLLERLPGPEREVVRLRLDGYEVAEIAGRIGRSKRSAERLLQEARARLVALLEVRPQ